MEYKVCGDRIVVRIDRGEEIVESLKAVCEKEGVKLAEVSALGAINKLEIGVFKTDTKQYKANCFEGYYEIVSLWGTVTTKDGEFYSHLHMSAGDENGKVVGGHLTKAWVSATCEMVITKMEGSVERTFNDDVGLNLFDFTKGA
ncbi:MAG: DNA-binding protein [Clostridia bacterium]|nr:DNA-binding protein [Clostridia bacterium]